MNPAVPSGASLTLPRYKDLHEIDILLARAVLQILPPRAADIQSKTFFVSCCLKVQLLWSAVHMAK